MESALNNIEACISKVLQATTDENVTRQSLDCNVDSVDTIIGKIIKARLDQVNRSIAKKKRKLIMKCLIDTDSEND